jgi:hypothetical protein
VLEYTIERVVDLGLWDELVETTYGRTYQFQQQDGCKSRGKETFTVPNDNPYDYDTDTVPEIINGDEMGVSFKAWIARDPGQKVIEDSGFDGTYLFWERNFYPTLESVSQDLYEKGLIEAGTYFIDIDW